MLAMTLALAAAAAPTVFDAERAFAQMAQDKGQWTAFRATAAPDAVMFDPQPVNAHDFMKDFIDPPKAMTWAPTQAWVSCDGSLAVDTGNWRRPDGATGYFTTVWKRQADGGWKWIYDGGRPSTSGWAAPAALIAYTASCDRKHDAPPPIVVEDTPGARQGHYESVDRTMSVSWITMPDGGRDFRVWFADRGQVMRDDIPAPVKK